MLRKRPCSLCRRWFHPDPRVGDRQFACSARDCQSKRRAKTQARWRALNPDYFAARRIQQRGEEAGERTPDPMRVPGSWFRVARQISCPIYAKNHPLSPLVVTGLILAGFEHLERLGLSHPTATSVLEATGAGRAQAYEYRGRVLDLLTQIAHPVGRPSKPAQHAMTDTAATITRELLAFHVLDGASGCGLKA